MKSTLFLFIISAFALFTACDQVDPLNSKKTVIEEPEDTTNTNKVLLVEFTGHFCGECPPAAELAHKLHESSNEKVVLLSIHSGGFANPTSKHPADYRTPVGDALNSYFTVSSNPIATISYKSFDGTKLLNYVKPDLESKIQAVLKQETKVKLSMDASISGNSLNVNVSSTVSIAGIFDHSLAVYLTEDSLQTWQKDARLNPTDNYNYYHNSVLRASFNGAFGETFMTGSLPKKSTLSKSLSLAINPKWNTKYLRAIALIIDNTTKEIIQVEEIKF